MTAGPSEGTSEPVLDGALAPGRTGPLAGLRVIELGNFIAAPTAGRLMAEFGAEVLKIELPAIGDEVRRWRLFKGETSMVWRTIGRNKKSVTINLRDPEGADLVLRLVRHCHVLLENYRPGKLESWGLGPERLQQANPELVVVRISGYGQTGPYRDRPGFGGVAEAMGGLRNVTGHPQFPPTRVGVSIGDTLAGLYAVIGALMGILSRQRADGGPGEVVDVALYEAVFSVMESLVPDYSAYGVVRTRTGNVLPGVAPSSTYPCRDDDWIVIGGNGDSIFVRLMESIGRPEIAHDPRFRDNRGRAANAEFLDEVIGRWTAARTLDEAMAVMVGAGVPAGPIYAADDIVKDPHFQVREMFVELPVAVGAETEPVLFPGIVPKLASMPGSVAWPGPDLGEHTGEVLGGLLGLSDDELAELAARGVV